MTETEKLLSKKNSNSTKRTTKPKHHHQKLFNNQDDYGTLTKQYIVQNEYPRLFKLILI